MTKHDGFNYAYTPLQTRFAAESYFYKMVFLDPAGTSRATIGADQAREAVKPPV